MEDPQQDSAEFQNPGLQKVVSIESLDLAVTQKRREVILQRSVEVGKKRNSIKKDEENLDLKWKELRNAFFAKSPEFKTGSVSETTVKGILKPSNKIAYQDRYTSYGYENDVDIKKQNLYVETVNDLPFMQEKVKQSKKNAEDDVYEVDTKGDWNFRFQSAMSKIEEYARNGKVPATKWIDVHKRLFQLSQDFLYSANTYGKVIISEVYLPLELKTIKPQKVGGLAGGEKYIIHNILFKFAVDVNSLYGSDYAAAKVAGNELKGLTCYSDMDMESIRVPLMALVDFRGFRLIAISLLPINGATILYGSSDAGVSIHDSKPEFNKIMKKSAKICNIKPHSVGQKELKTLYSPADLEGHRGFDGRYYLLDFSRVMPPEAPKPELKNSHLWRVLRPEFVRKYKIPLCSDAFTRFSPKAEMNEHNREIVIATEHLYSVVIPKCAAELDEKVGEAIQKGQSLRDFRLNQIVHSQGVNLRHLGWIRHCSQNVYTKILVLIEICARVVKNSLNLHMRSKMEQLRVPLEKPYRRMTVSFLNVVFGVSKKCTEFWKNNIKSLILKGFSSISLTEQEKSSHYSLKDSLNFHHLNHAGKTVPGELNDINFGFLLFYQKVEEMTGVKLLVSYLDILKNPDLLNTEEPLDETDLLSIESRIKPMNIVKLSAGFLYKWKGIDKMETEPEKARRFLQASLETFEECLNSNPNHMVVLKNVAHSLTYLDILEHGELIINSPRAERAKMYYLRSIEQDPKNAQSLALYAKFLQDLKDFHGAEEYYLKSLETDPFNPGSLNSYAQFLKDIKKDDFAAEKFFEREREAVVQFSN